MRKNLYVFISSSDDDKTGRISILTTNVKRAYKLVMLYFRDNNYKGVPELLAI